ncbi:hypothetical protein CDIK_1382 [Cucumispora dikerogammari]|nr:hypothetical protein CDIK_1382 [Cucumispora dikerogammari]
MFHKIIKLFYKSEVILSSEFDTPYVETQSCISLLMCLDNDEQIEMIFDKKDCKSDENKRDLFMWFGVHFPSVKKHSLTNLSDNVMKMRVKMKRPTRNISLSIWHHPRYQPTTVRLPRNRKITNIFQFSMSPISEGNYNKPESPYYLIFYLRSLKNLDIITGDKLREFVKRFKKLLEIETNEKIELYGFKFYLTFLLFNADKKQYERSEVSTNVFSFVFGSDGCTIKIIKRHSLFF